MDWVMCDQENRALLKEAFPEEISDPVPRASSAILILIL
jgi:hypothetical protein